MNENIKIFLQKVSEEKALQAKLQACKGPDDAYEFAANIQSGFTKEEFQSTMKELKANMSRDLSDEDLEKTAGGGITKPITYEPISFPGAGSAAAAV